MKLSDYDPSNFYNNRGYKAITSNPNTPMMAKPQFVSNYKPSFNNTPSSSTNNRRPPLLGIMKYKSNPNIGNMYRVITFYVNLQSKL